MALGQPKLRAVSIMANCDPPPPNSCKRLKIEEECVLNNLTDDLLLEILIRLSVSDYYRFVIRCSLVCKRWFSVISSPYFPKRRVRPTTLLLQMGDSTRLPRYYIPPQPTTSTIVDRKPLSSFSTHYLNFLPEAEVMVRASYNDLLLVSGSRKLYICNPFTRLWFLLPPHPPGILSRGPARFGLSCEEEPNSKYKYRVLLVCYCYTQPSTDITVVIFRSETGKWSKTVFSCPWMPSYFSQDVVFYNGKFHWLEGRVRPRIIMTFNPDRNRCSHIHLPIDFGKGGNSNVFLGVSEGRLRLTKVRLKKINGECKNLWKVWEIIKIKYKDVDNRQSSWSWRLVHHKAFSSTVAAEKSWWGWLMGTDMITFHPDNGDVVFSVCNDFNRVFRHNLPEGKSDHVLQVVGNDINLFRLRLDDDDDSEKMTMAFYTLSESCCPPVAFHLLHLSPPTPLPTILSD